MTSQETETLPGILVTHSQIPATFGLEETAGARPVRSVLVLRMEVVSLVLGLKQHETMLTLLESEMLRDAAGIWQDMDVTVQEMAATAKETGVMMLQVQAPTLCEMAVVFRVTHLAFFRDTAAAESPETTVTFQEMDLLLQRTVVSQLQEESGQGFYSPDCPLKRSAQDLVHCDPVPHRHCGRNHHSLQLQTGRRAQSHP